MDHISCLQPVPNSKRSQVIKLKRNGDGQLTHIKIYRELFIYISRLDDGYPALASIFVLYDLLSGVFWWHYFEEEDDDEYFTSEIDEELNDGYRKDEEAIYNYSDSLRNSQIGIYFSANKIAEFYVGTELVCLGSQGQYDTFEHAYDHFMATVKKTGNFPKPPKGEVRLWEYLDRHFFRIPNFPQSPIITKLIGLKHSEDKWMIEIEGCSYWWEDNPQKKARVIVVLNENYELVEILGEDYLKKK
jgi:hypothetical protein